MSITYAKKRKLIKTARFFLTQNPSYAHLDCRFDVIAFNQVMNSKGDQDFLAPEWVQGAFLANAW